MEVLEVEVDYKDFLNKLQEFNSKIPRVGQRLMQSVNAEVKKQIKAEAKSRGYKANKKQSWGNSGFSKNLKSYQNSDFTAKIMMAKPAFYYRFIEYGANITPKNGEYLCFKINGKFYKSKGFSLPARPLIYPIANSIWGTNKASEIMEARFQKELDAIFEGKKGALRLADD